MKAIHYKPIGIIHSPFKTRAGMPIQPAGAKGVQGTVTINRDYFEGLKDLEGFSHLILIYHFHLSTDFSLSVTPFMDDKPRGVFATRAPKRPNPIGLSVVQLNRIEANTLFIENVDIIDKTPLLDIKPYVPAFDVFKNVKAGWLTGKEKTLPPIKSDNRFS
ncbi:MAG: tRNA (N6-threonylcarbamoyladenosine(37)-N6)-methyltransferase TrmO [Thermodesulfobacteriota bacterium]